MGNCCSHVSITNDKICRGCANSDPYPKNHVYSNVKVCFSQMYCECCGFLINYNQYYNAKCETCNNTMCYYCYNSISKCKNCASSLFGMTNI
jgi:hypothetical protein